MLQWCQQAAGAAAAGVVGQDAVAGGGEAEEGAVAVITGAGAAGVATERQ